MEAGHVAVEAAESFAADPSLPDAMARAGFEGEPSINVASLAEHKSCISPILTAGR